MVKTEPTPLTKEEMTALLKASMDDEFYYTLFKVAVTTGRRIGELTEVMGRDHLYDSNILITRVLKRRRRVEKEAILSPEVNSLLKQFIIRNRIGLDDYIFRKYTIRTIQNKVKYFAKKAGITKNVSPHNFRHYLITELVRKGWSYDKIAKITGHSSLGTLTAYDHAVASDVKADILEALHEI